MLDRSTIWPYEDGEPGEFYYQRYGHPAGVEAERALGELEGGHALLFPSGSGAETALLLALLEPGKTVALTQDAYYGTALLMRMLERWDLRMVEFDQTGQPPDGADLVWVEAPSNPLLSMPDLDAAADHPAPLVVDSSCTARQSSSGAITTCSSAPWCARRRRTTTDYSSSARAPESLPRRTRRGFCSAA
jgi:cystathionine beta-lyase/cystathionine gamma-synthase